VTTSAAFLIRASDVSLLQDDGFDFVLTGPALRSIIERRARLINTDSDCSRRRWGMRVKRTVLLIALSIAWTSLADAQGRSITHGGRVYIEQRPSHFGGGGGGYSGLGGGQQCYPGSGHHGGRYYGGSGYLGGGYYGGGYLGIGGYYGGYYSGYTGFGLLGPGYVALSGPGYSFFSGTTTVVPLTAWSPQAGAGYYYGPSSFYPDPYGPGIATPGVYQPVPDDDQAVLQEWLDDNRRALENPAGEIPLEQRPQRFIQPSSSAAQVRSVRLQHEGDLELKNLQYGVAARRYEEAIEAAPDLPESYFRLAIAEAARSNFAVAVRRLKEGLQLDADWPRTAARLEDLVGENNLLARTLIKQRVAEWTLENGFDPDRLFLLGVLLYLEGDDRNVTMFEAAERLVGTPYYLTAFLQRDAAQGQAEANPGEAPVLPPQRPGEGAAVPERDPGTLLPPLPEPPPPGT
jgi:hypothetical protein